MKRSLFTLLFALLSTAAIAQTTLSPTITNWMINTTSITGRHYVSGNFTPITDTIQANVQKVQYSTSYCYVNCSGIPAYVIGPYLDGNPAQGTHNEWLFKIPLNPTENTGVLTSTPLGPIGLLINGVPIYDYKDAMSYNNEGVWNRDAVINEMDGFDCAKGHPSPIFSGPPGPGGTLEGGTYHHHQNPSAFNLDIVEVSDVCDLYLADGLYVIDSSQHSPLLGYAFDGYPIYGAYAYADTVGGGGIKRIKSSWQKRSITVRTHYADGSDVTDGPAVSATYPLGTYREDYEYIAGSGDLDEHNGRFCVTPEYPGGTYAYFATIDENWNSAFPYFVGPEYYGIVETSNFVAGGGSNSTTITESTTVYDPSTASDNSLLEDLQIAIFPNPASDMVAIQAGNILRKDLSVSIYDLTGKLLKTTRMNQGSTICHLDTRTLYNGTYLVKISDGSKVYTHKVIVQK